MRAIGLQRAAALLVTVVLACPAGLLTAAPAAAAPERTAAEPALGSSLLDAFTAWLVTLWPDAEAAVNPQHGIDLDLKGRSTVELRHGIELGGDDGPTGMPQHGGDLDPDG